MYFDLFGYRCFCIISFVVSSFVGAVVHAAGVSFPRQNVVPKIVGVFHVNSLFMCSRHFKCKILLLFPASSVMFALARFACRDQVTHHDLVSS